MKEDGQGQDTRSQKALNPRNREQKNIFAKERFTIGEVSQISNLSRKSLRFYEERGIISPSIRGDNNYRYYTSTHIQEAIIISSLKQRGFSYSEICDLLKDSPTARDVYRALNEKVDKIQAEIERLTEQLEQTKSAANQILKAVRTSEDAGLDASADVEFSYLPEHTVIFTRYSSYINANQTAWWDRMAEIYKMCAEFNCHISGAMCAIYHEHFLNQFFFDYGDTEVLIPVDDDTPLNEHIKHMGGYLIASKVHQGPYRELLPVYIDLVKQIDKRGYKLAGPAMEQYLIEFSQGANEENFITRVCFPVEEKAPGDEGNFAADSDIIERAMRMVEDTD